MCLPFILRTLLAFTDVRVEGRGVAERIRLGKSLGKEKDALAVRKLF